MRRRVLLSLLASALLTLPGSADAATFLGSGMTVPEQGPAAPYPSAIQTSGLAGVPTHVSVTLRGVTYRFVNDLDVLLVAPGGQNVILLSDACSGDEWRNVDVTFDDNAPTVASIGTEPCFDDIYKPTNYGGGDTFPAPAPGGPYGSALAPLSGADPNGPWSLYVVDDTALQGGSIAGWAIDLEGVTSGLKCAGRRATIVGTQGRDMIRGTGHADVIVALGGNDTVVGGKGKDRVCGGQGNDRLYGGSGKDKLYGGKGNDKLVGGPGHDKQVQ